VNDPLFPQERPGEEADGKSLPKGLIDEQSFPAAGPVSESSERQAEVLSAFQALQEKVSGLAVRLDQVAEVVDLTARQVTFLPPQVRNLSSKVDRAVEAIGESRYQSLLLRLLGIYDLVCQMEATELSLLRNESGELRTSSHAVLRTQLRQLLETNGLNEIPVEGRFDPSLHLSVGRIDCNDPALDGQVLEVVRPGFKTETSVLRFAEVRVGQCGASAAPSIVQTEEEATNG
jgi:molecular chaperone GrpE (heat shock protein)